MQQQVLLELLPEVEHDDDQPDLHQLLIRWCAS